MSVQKRYACIIRYVSKDSRSEYFDLQFLFIYDAKACMLINGGLRHMKFSLMHYPKTPNI